MCEQLLNLDCGYFLYQGYDAMFYRPRWVS